MSLELRQIAEGFTYSVKTLNSYDVNGYRFHTLSHEEKRPNRKTTNCGVLCKGSDGLEYYGRVEEIYELDFHFGKKMNPVVFKCHWFDPTRVRRKPEVGLVEIERASVYAADDVYILAHQATQVFYLPYPCKTMKRLQGWDVVMMVPPRTKPPTPNDDDYHHRINPNTYEGEFYQEDGLIGGFNINLPTIEEMEEDNDDMGVDNEQDDSQVVLNSKDVELLERLKIPDVEEPTGPPPNYLEDWWYSRDSDDDDAGPSYDPRDVDNGF